MSFVITAFAPLLPTRTAIRARVHHSFSRISSIAAPRSTLSFSSAAQTRCTFFKDGYIGNGGIDNQVDWSNFDEEALLAEIAEAEQDRKENPITHTTSPWTIIMNLDILQFQNNLFEASRNYGYQWDLNKAMVIPLCDATAVREIQDVHPTVWMPYLDGAPIRLFFQDKEGLLCFIKEVDAGRFAEQAHADTNKEAKVVEQSTIELRRQVDKDNMLIGVVPSETLVSPSLLGGF